VFILKKIRGCDKVNVLYKSTFYHSFRNVTEMYSLYRMCGLVQHVRVLAYRWSNYTGYFKTIRNDVGHVIKLLFITHCTYIS